MLKLTISAIEVFPWFLLLIEEAQPQIAAGPQIICENGNRLLHSHSSHSGIGAQAGGSAGNVVLLHTLGASEGFHVLTPYQGLAA